MDQDNKAGWQYKPDGAEPGAAADGAASAPAARPPAPHAAVAWEAPEYIEHHHGPVWYLALIVVTVGLAAAIYFLSTRDLFAAIIVLVLGVIVGAFAAHKPANIKYEISAAGLNINGKTYNYGDYKSFSIIREGQLSSVNLLPLKRLSPPLAAYYDPAQEKKIITALGEHLPYDSRQLDTIDRLARRLRL